MVEEKTAEATKTLENALQGLANAIEHRDLESGQHVKRTQLYVRALVDYLIECGSIYAEELKKLQPDIIMKSMALHDVGKIAIPDKILLKPGKLDPDEYEIMKTHTTRGKEIIGELGDVNISQYLKHCEDICYSHHERWDGKGYPDHVFGPAIDIGARVVSVADAFEAMVSKKPYRNPMVGYQAVKNLLADNARRFDPAVIMAFTKVMGIYPIGSIVRLSDGSVARVVSLHVEAPLRPVVQMLMEEDGTVLSPDKKVTIDLLEVKTLFIKEAVDPADFAGANE